MKAQLFAKKLLNAVRSIHKKAVHDQLAIHAASLAFSSVLSLIPLTALAYFFFDAFGGLEKLQEQMQGFMIENLAPSFGDKLHLYMGQIKSHISAGAMGIFGLVGFIYTGFSMLFKMESSFNHIWGIKKMRPMVRRITNHWAVITLSPILVAASISSTTYVIGWLKHDNGEVARMLLLLFTFIPYFIMAFLFTSVYLILPATLVNRRAAMVGGVISGISFEVAKQAYAVYASNALGKSVYGSLAVFPIFLIWIQVAWFILLYGAEIAYYFQTQFGPSTASGSDEGER